MKQKQLQQHQGRRGTSSWLSKMFALVVMMLCSVGSVWGQASYTSETYKFKGKKAHRVYAPDMPYSTSSHHQTGTFQLLQGESRVLFDVAGNKGLQSAGTFTDGVLDGKGGTNQILDYGNFVIRTSQLDGLQTHYRLKFHYGAGKIRHLDIYRHEEPDWGKVGDKNDGLVVISLQTAALFQSDDEVKSINKIEIECLPYNGRGFKVEACYFITMMPDFDYTDIDGNLIKNAYIHPSFLIPSNGVNVYPYGEENGTPADDNYIVEIEEATNYFVDNDPTKPIDWHKDDSEGKKDSLSYTNPKLVWSMNYATPQDMTDVTYCTVDRWGDNASVGHFNGDALWRWIFVHRELFNVASGASSQMSNLTLDGFNVYKDGNVVDMSCAKTLMSNVKTAYGQSGSVRKGINLNAAPYNTYKYLVVRKNIISSEPYFGFNVKSGDTWTNEYWVGPGLNGTYYEQNGDYRAIKLDDLRSAYPDGLIFFSVENSGNDLNAADVFFSNGAVDHENVSSNLKPDAEYWHGNKEDAAYWGTTYATGSGGNTIYGQGIGIQGNTTDYADLTDYGQLIIYTDGACPRVFINGNQVESPSGSGKFIFNLSDYKDSEGNVHLNAIKNGWPAVNVKGIELVKYWAPTPYGRVASVETSNFALYDDNCNNLNIQLAAARENVAKDQKIIYGADNTYQYKDLSDYDNLIVTASGEPLFLFNKNGDEALICYPPVGGSEYYTKMGDTYNINLTAIKAHYGYAHLHGILNWTGNDINGITMKLEKIDPDQASNYRCDDKDAIHFYNSVYNGDFTNTPYGCHGGNHATREKVNYIYYQTFGNEHNQIMCDAEHVPADRMPVKVDDKIIGYYANVTADGHLVSKDDMKNIKMSIKDICLTKNKVEVQQNHANVAKLYGSAGELPATAQETILGDATPNMDNKADLTGYDRLMIKGQPQSEIRLFFNADDDTHRIERKVKLDAIGYMEFDLTDPELIYNGTKTECHGGVYLSSIKGAAWGEKALLNYVRAVKDKDDNAEGAKNLIKEMFYSWNGKINGTVTRQHNPSFVNKIGSGETLGTGATVFADNGSGEIYSNRYVELTGYKYIKVTGDAGTQVRITYNAQSEPEEKAATGQFGDETYTIPDEGPLYIDISNHQYFHLHTMKTGWTHGGKIDEVRLIPDPRVDYVLRGNGTLSVDAANAMLDPTACVIDARPRVNNKQVIDLYTEVVYDGNPEVYEMAKWIGLSDETLVLEPQAYDPHRNRYIRMANQNCIVMVRGDFDSTQETVGYEEITNAQYWHGIRSMHHANMAIIPADYDGTAAHKVMTAGLFLVDGFPYRIPMQLRITQGNTGSYARVNNTAAGTRAIVNTICVPFTVTLATMTGDTNSIYASNATDRNALNGEETRCQFYKITDLVKNTVRETTTAGLLQQDVVGKDDYVFWFEPVSELEPYHPYVFVNKYNGQLREGDRMEVYTGWAGAHNDVYPTVNPDGTMCQNMNNSSDKTDLNGEDKDDYYLRGTNAAKHIRDCWYFNTQGRLVKAKYMTNNTFRAVLKSDSRTINMPFENDPEAEIKVVRADWMNGAEETVAVEAIDVTDDAMVSVYSINGILLRPSVELGIALEGLPSGIYIVNGKKAVKK